MTPFYERLPKIDGFGVDVSADAIGVGIVAGTAAAFTAHGIVKSIQKRSAEKAEASGGKREEKS
jgi:hydrogenase small subunit